MTTDEEVRCHRCTDGLVEDQLTGKSRQCPLCWGSEWVKKSELLVDTEEEPLP